MIDTTDAGFLTLANNGLQRLSQAARGRRAVSKASGVALVAGYHAKGVLRMVQATPARVTADALDTNPARDSLRFLNVSLRGWWR